MQRQNQQRKQLQIQRFTRKRRVQIPSRCPQFRLPVPDRANCRSRRVFKLALIHVPRFSATGAACLTPTAAQLGTRMPGFPAQPARRSDSPESICKDPSRRSAPVCASLRRARTTERRRADHCRNRVRFRDSSLQPDPHVSCSGSSLRHRPRKQRRPQPGKL